MRVSAWFLALTLAAAMATAQCGWNLHPGLACDRQWRSPVETVADLPADGNLRGDMRVVMDPGVAYFWDGDAWVDLRMSWYAPGNGTSTFVGEGAGGGSLTAANTVCVGNGACGSAGLINYGVAVGAGAGRLNAGGDKNTFVGRAAGEVSIGDRMVCIGFNSCRYASGSDQLYIANSETATPLVWGDFATGTVRLGNAITIRGGGVIHFVPLAGPPSSPEEGDVYYDAGKKDLCVFDGEAWSGMKGPC